MNLLKEVEDSLRYWTECAVRDMKAGDPYNHRDKSLERAANLATIALALRAAEKGSTS